MRRFIIPRLFAFGCLWLPQVSRAATPAAVHKLARGETLADLAEQTYGHRHYQLVIIKLNHIANPAALVLGTELRLPEFQGLLMKEGFPPQLGRDVNSLALTHRHLLSMQDELAHVAQAEKLNRSAPGGLSQAARRTLERDAAALSRLAQALVRRGSGPDVPVHMQQRVQALASILLRLSTAEADRELEDQAHLLLAQCFVRGIMWARGENQTPK